MHKRNAPANPFAAWSALTAAYATFFVFLEMLKAVRASSWAGFTTNEWVGVALAWALYAALLGCASWPLYAGLRFVSRGRIGPAGGLPVSAALAAAVLWSALSLYREVTPTLDDILVAVAVAGILATTTLPVRLGILPLRAACGVAITALAAGGAALIGAGFLYYFSPEPSSVCTLAAAGWTVLSGALALAAWGFPGRAWPAARRWGISAALIALPLAPLLPVWHEAAPPGKNEKPNLVFIIVDTLRADYCSVYGGPCPTPALEALARDGAFFLACESLAPWTPPSMSAMFGSVYPPGLDAGPTRKRWIEEMWRYELRDRDTPLAELIEADGRDTCALVGNPLVPGMRGMLRGFRTSTYAPPMLKRKEGLFIACPFLQDALAEWFPILVRTRFNDTTEELTRRALTFLRRRGGHPFYLWIHYIDPHAPYDPPEKYRPIEGPSGAFSPIIDDMAWLKDGPHEDCLGGYDSAAREHTISLYKGEVRHVDDAIGRLCAELERLELERNTYVCVSADHGEELWEHGAWGHGQNLHEELTHVPLIIAGPGIAQRMIVTPVSAINLMPTLAALAGVAPAPSWRGVSLAPALLDGAASIAPEPCFARGTSQRVRVEPLEMVRLGTRKLIRGVTTGSVRLYDLEADPGETRDIASLEPQCVSRLTELLDAWNAANPPDFDAFFGGGAPASNRREVLQQLRSIGYL